MSIPAWQLAADLSKLKMIADIDLPMMADLYEKATTAVGGTIDADTSTFQYRGKPGVIDGIVYEPWTDLRDQLMRVLQ